MQVKLIQGLHVTATQKRHIAEIIANGWNKGSTKSMSYYIEKIADEDNMYAVEIHKADRNDYGKKFNSVLRVKVEVK